MKICGISDMHGNLNFKVDKCDVLCICGDFIPLRIQGKMPASREWIKNEFIPWCEKQEVEKILLIAGNHDFICERDDVFMHIVFENTKVTYLRDEVYEYVDENGKSYKFYGTPWCHIFGNWAFMLSDEDISKKLANMPDDVDVLLTHDSPYGVSDVILQNTPWRTDKHIGCIPIRDIVLEKKPGFLLHGHLHSTNHDLEMLDSTRVYCVSVLDEFYEYAYKPLYLDI